MTDAATCAEEHGAPQGSPSPGRRGDSRQSSSSLLSEQSLSSSHLHTEGIQRSFRHRNWSSSHSLTGPAGDGGRVVSWVTAQEPPTVQPWRPRSPAGIGKGEIPVSSGAPGTLILGEDRMPRVPPLQDRLMVQ